MFIYFSSLNLLNAEEKKICSEFKKFSKADGWRVVSGFKIRAYFVLTFFKAKLFDFP